MDDDELELVANAWVDFHKRTRPGGGDIDFRAIRDLEPEVDWAAQKLLDLVVNDPSAALRVIELVSSVSSDIWVLTNL